MYKRDERGECLHHNIALIEGMEWIVVLAAQQYRQKSKMKKIFYLIDATWKKKRIQVIGKLCFISLDRLRKCTGRLNKFCPCSYFFGCFYCRSYNSIFSCCCSISLSFSCSLPNHTQILAETERREDNGYVCCFASTGILLIINENLHFCFLYMSMCTNVFFTLVCQCLLCFFLSFSLLPLF